MKAICLGVALALLWLTGCNDSHGPQKKGTSSGEPSPGNYLNNLTAQQRATKTVDTVTVNTAVERFYVQEGRCPKDLLELVELRYLSRLPELPAGANWDYDTNSGVVSIIQPQK